MQKHTFKLHKLLVVSALLAMTAFVPIPTALAQDLKVAVSSPDMNVNTDNSAMNKGDQDSQRPTADQAGNQMSDRDIMQKIRKSVVSDTSLSTYAHNVKIISQNGKVTLKGPVKSDQEKQNVEAKATSVVGSGNVDNDLTISQSN